MSRRAHVLRPASRLDTLRAALALALAGALAPRFHRFFFYVSTSPAIGLAAAATAALQVGLVLLSQHAARAPLVPALLAWAGGSSGGRKGGGGLGSALARAAWTGPASAACIILSLQLAGAVASLALGVREAAGAGGASPSSSPSQSSPTPATPARLRSRPPSSCPASPAPGPAARAAGAGFAVAARAVGARPSRTTATARPPRPAAAAAGAAFRAALMGSLLAQAAAARALLPAPAAGLVGGWLTALIYGWYTHDYAWVAAGLALPARLATLEAAWPFFAAFGAVAACPSIFPFPGLPPLQAGALTTALFPVFIVLAIDAGPGAGAAAAARVAGDAAGRRGVAIQPHALPILGPAIGATTALVVRALPPGAAVVRWVSGGSGSSPVGGVRRRAARVKAA